MFEFTINAKPDVAAEQNPSTSTSKPSPTVKVGNPDANSANTTSQKKTEPKKNQTEELIDEAAKLLKKLFK